MFSCNEKKTSVPMPDSELVFAEEDNSDTTSYSMDYGFDLKNYKVDRDTVRRGDNLQMILARHNFDATDISEIYKRKNLTAEFKNLKTGNKLTVLKSKENIPKPQVLIYEPDKTIYKVIDFRDSIHVYEKQFPVTYKTKTVAGEIDGGLYPSLERLGLDTGLVKDLTKHFAWTIDFFKFNKGDIFAISVRERYINDTIYAGVDEILGAYFNYKNKDVYGFPHQTSYGTEFYDENGKQMRTMFLKSPLQYFRITSKFSKNRFHPVQKKWKAHNGTDYAAPQGTPIMTTASGIVVETGYTSGNGNYVKVKHDNTYSTQYLHMSKILVKRGQRVNQGDIIGKVGSTGLATGPHVCYRFWKNGVQVDPLKLNLPTSQILNDGERTLFLNKIKQTKLQLDKVVKEKQSKQ